MNGYISELDYFGTSDQEFVEIAVPAGTDVSSYTLVFYQADGTIYETVSLGSYTGTFGGQDVYVVNQSTPGFDSGGDSMGTFYPDDAIALVDGSGTVLQFISWEGNTVSAIEGPASGMSSTNAGFADQSLQSDDGGATYYAQSNSNEGSIPACYAPGTFIETPLGLRRVEYLRVGDQIWTADSGAQTIRWIWDGIDPLEDVDDDNYPVLIQAGALGPELPKHDLIVSPQHRILVGAGGQLEGHFASEVFVPAKSLTSLPGIRFKRGKTKMRWLHLSCDGHEVVRANGCLSETLYLGPMVLRNLPQDLLRTLRNVHANATSDGALNGPLARRCLTVGDVKDRLRRSRRHAIKAKLEVNE
ncbi:Hint domain-containing protein [uncultured Tateyamaria sp.]|uniref:Hint domain-containing protein n=1 Tax=uncultured Tateyamaria sp. TaxID=455651 RepID=UPI0026290A81|nr:Hint domain-containing protein [uncultured Tateyamaria sp.]